MDWLSNPRNTADGCQNRKDQLLLMPLSSRRIPGKRPLLAAPVEMRTQWIRRRGIFYRMRKANIFYQKILRIIIGWRPNGNSLSRWFNVEWALSSLYPNLLLCTGRILIELYLFCFWSLLWLCRHRPYLNAGQITSIGYLETMKSKLSDPNFSMTPIAYAFPFFSLILLWSS